MAAERILVIDAGTSSLRAVAVSVDGDALLLAAEPWRIVTPDDAAPFGREIDVAALRLSLQVLIERSAAAGPFAGVATTGQREGLVFAGDDGPVCVSPNIDGRAAAEGMRLDRERGDEIYRATGHLPSLMQAPAKLAWLREHRPDDAAAVRMVQPLGDWLATALTGAPAMSRSLAAENGLLDLRSGAAPGYLPDAGVPRALLPPVRDDGWLAGHVDGGGFAGVPVILAGADTQCALAGMGAVGDGECGVPAGWSAPLQLVMPAPVLDDEMRTWTGLHVVPGKFVLESNASETGRAWGWACDLLGVPPAGADALAATSPAGARDVTAALGARAMRASAMNAGLGAIAFPLPLVMSAPSRGDIVRAVLESTAYAIRGNLEQLEEIGGLAIERLRLGGGMSRSALFAQIVADVIDRPVEVARAPETTAVGAAAVAAVTLGLHASLDDAVGAMCGPRRTVEPELRASAAYEDYYAQWCAMVESIERMASEGG